MIQGAETGRSYEAAELLGGEDEEFVVNLYLALLRRWPDAAGHRHYTAQVAGRPEARLEVLREIAASVEAARAGIRVVFPDGACTPPGPTRALALSLAIRTEWLRAELARLRAEGETLREALGAACPGLPVAELIEGRDAALHFEINALRREVTERLDRLGRPAVAADAAGWNDAVAALSRLVVEHAGDRLAALEARYEQRCRAQDARNLALEARILALEARLRA